MNITKYDDLFHKDLGAPDFVYSPKIESAVSYEAYFWNPVLTLEGIWACKLVVIENSKRNVTIMPGDNYIEAILRAAKFLQEIDCKFGIKKLPNITFPFEEE